MHFTEAHFENAILELMRDTLGYDYVYGPSVEREYTEPLHIELVQQSLYAINPTLPAEAVEEAIAKIRTIESGSLVQRNEQFTDYLQNGVEVNYFDGKEQCATRVKLIDYDTPLRNNFTVANQWTVEERSVRRADIVVFVNGLPLVVVELKSPSRENTDVSEAYAQLRNYMIEIPSLFVYNAFCVMSDMATSKGEKSESDKVAIQFIKSKIDSAKWFMSAIKQRHDTLMRTMQTILDYQQEYFKDGDRSHLRPMILKDIADRTGLDVSTISRVANSKYVQTSFGIILLKSLFSEAMQTVNGEEVSSYEIKNLLEKCIEEENKRHPLTDEQLMNMLNDKGYCIARRTVAKYREMLGIPVARLRKEI